MNKIKETLGKSFKVQRHQIVWLKQATHTLTNVAVWLRLVHLEISPGFSHTHLSGTRKLRK